MDGVCVCLVGNTLLASGVAEMLLECRAVSRLECFPSLAVAVPFLDTQPTDVLILVDLAPEVFTEEVPCLPIYPDVPIICAHHQSIHMKLILTTHLPARLTNLLDVVVNLHRA